MNQEIAWGVHLMNYMIFQRKNKLIHILKTYMYYYNSEAAELFNSSKGFYFASK